MLLSTEVEKYSPESTEIYRKKLYDKMTELLGATNIDEQRILMEAAIFSEKAAGARRFPPQSLRNRSAMRESLSTDGTARLSKALSYT